MGVDAVAQLQVEGFEELALKLLRDASETPGQRRELTQDAEVLLAGLRFLLGQRLHLCDLRLSGPGQVGVATLEPFTEITVDVVVARRDVIFSLSEHVVLPFLQVEDLLSQLLDRGVILRGTLSQVCAGLGQAMRVEDAIGEELVHEIQQVVLPDPQALGDGRRTSRDDPCGAADPARTRSKRRPRTAPASAARTTRPRPA
ncbi:hypothetical protein ABGB14_11695 [Nonomuraea sp. B10E15]|uniref:hypothetical protein n=1 Tax=Nonomuraea sp. B10E15 TaxID=3153560 RepID=UPI00325C3707